MAEAPVTRGSTIEIELAWALSGDAGLRSLRVPVGMRLVELWAWLREREPGLSARFTAATEVRIWGAAVSESRILQPGDRLEIAGGLLADPKTARRRRARAGRAS